MRSTDLAALAGLLALVACAGKPAKPTASIGNPTGSKVKIGKPYQVVGVWYTPTDDRHYDVVGVASWYGPGFHGLDTANGERYAMDGLTAAHKTLPMPSYVEVTNLLNGRVLVVRINDRGPFVDGRIIDLSRHAAQLLGIDRAGTAKVRVRRVFPGVVEMAALAPPPAPPPAPATAQPPIVAALPRVDIAAPSVAVTSVDVAPTQAATTAATGIFIQVAAVKDQGRAEWLRGFLAPYGPVTIAAAPSGLWRVRIGPEIDEDSAASTLARVQAAGYSDAQIVRVVVPIP